MSSNAILSATLSSSLTTLQINLILSMHVGGPSILVAAFFASIKNRQLATLMLYAVQDRE